MTSTLSKTKFRSGMQCVKKLWFENSKTVEPTPPTASDQLNFERGHEVELRAREQFKNCTLIGAFDLEEAAEETFQAIKKGAATIAQATFVKDNLAARIDILQMVSEGIWNLTEIKMAGEVKDEHIPDVSFQKHVVELCGLKVAKCFVMHLNKDCVYPDLSNLFSRIDVTNSVLECSSEIKEQSSVFLGVLGQTEEPSIRIGGRCSKPHSCHFEDHCWKGVPQHSIFTIPRLGDKKTEQLLDENILEVIHVPPTLKLTDIQKRYVDLIKGGLPIINRNEIASALNTLEYPLYFLDFEADRPPLPQFEHMRPFSLLPFQFSLHVLNRDGTLKHHAFLHNENTDCRFKISSELDKYIGPTGSVVVYNKTFEKGVLEYLASFATDYEQKLLSIRDRLWDQLDIFKDFYMHPAFAGSNSLKVVLETLVPILSYRDMKVGSGDGAIAAWVKMIKTNDQSERNTLNASLLAYCHLDSLAMVEIHKHLQALIDSN